MTFQDACYEAIHKAQEHNVAFYVYSGPTMWDITPTYKDVFQGGDKWLFKAFPGGRWEMTVEGKHVHDREQTDQSYIGP